MSSILNHVTTISPLETVLESFETLPLERNEILSRDQANQEKQNILSPAGSPEIILPPW